MSTVTVFDYYTYDTADRMLMHRQKINSQPMELIVHNKYDELGQLIQKKVGDAAPTGSYTYENLNVLQTVDYSYNIRGWLRKINDPNVTLSQKLFAFELHYNTPQNGATPLFNGNISETHWKTSLDGTAKRGYKYTYDALNRLTSADYVTSTPLYIQGTQQLENYFEGNITYDKNGNILTLDRKGLRNNNTIDYIDKLAYSYYPLSNRLRKVQDDAGPEGFKQTTSTDPNQYEYDSNGNMKLDRNKEILDITYNHLNLPVHIIFAGGGTITYMYNALGVKQQKTVQDGTTTTITDYNGAFVYEQTGANPKTLQFITQPEGYAKRNSNGVFSYIYQFRDHLGNTRLSYTKNGSGALEVIEIDHYYPFGLKHKGYHQGVSSLGNSVAQRRKYNGMEWQEELNFNLYDYGARNYDPALGRWMNIDPLAEQGRRWTPYNYAFDNPVYFIDPDGMWGNPFKRLYEKAKVAVVSYAVDKARTVVSNGKEMVKEKAVSKAVEITADVVTAPMKLLNKIDSSMGGYMLSNGKGGSTGDQKLIRKVDRDNPNQPEMVDASGIQRAGEMFRPGAAENKITSSKGKPETTRTSTGRTIDKMNDMKEGFEKSVEGTIEILAQQDTTSWTLSFWKDGESQGGSGFGRKAGFLKASEKAAELLRENSSLDSISVEQTYK